MRRILTVAALLSVVGTANASDRLIDQATLSAPSDYAAMAFYRVSFGGERGGAIGQTVGFRAFNQLAAAQGIPDFVKAEFDGTSVPTVHMNGLNITLISMALQQAPAQGGLLGGLGGLSAAELVTLGLLSAGILGGAIVSNEDKSNPPVPVGTGSGGS